MIVDGNTVITGSFNFTLTAEKENAENLLVIAGKERITAAYQRNFDGHLAHATKYQKPE